MKFLILSALIASSAFAGNNDLSHRPKSFSTRSGKAVFADFTDAVYTINYDIGARSATAHAEITVNVIEDGLIVFDSVQVPTAITLDGKAVTATEQRTPNNETTVRVLDASASAGTHKLTVDVPLTELVDYTADGVKSAFWTSDLDERNFMERYLPASFEYDQVKMTFNVNFTGNNLPQTIYTNGVVTEKGKNAYSISYPKHFNVSSIFFHTVPQGSTNEIKTSFRSIDGRDIPVTIYSAKSVWGGSGSLERFRAKAQEVFAELEGDYGAWPHAQLLIINAGMGGMEYCGATMTDLSSLGHEMFHSYFARGVMPANGNSGWLDEALASWRDNSYPRAESLSGTSGMSSHPYYTRITDDAAYSFGARFMSYLDGKLAAKGGLKPFMRYMVEKKIFAPLFVEEFAKEMSTQTGISVEADFKKYTYGGKSMEKSTNPVHRKMTLKELKNYL
jgi:hypothetical protein